MNTVLPYPSIELSFPSEFGYEKVAREAVAAFARRFGFDQERIEDLKTALGEACINAIEHGNQRKPGLRVAVSCVCDEQQLTVEIYDRGLKIFQGEVKAADITSKLCGQAPLRGMGLLLISQLVDEAGFAQAADEGNCFRLALYRRAAVPQRAALAAGEPAFQGRSEPSAR